MRKLMPMFLSSPQMADACVGALAVSRSALQQKSHLCNNIYILYIHMYIYIFCGILTEVLLGMGVVHVACLEDMPVGIARHVQRSQVRPGARDLRHRAPLHTDFGLFWAPCPRPFGEADLQVRLCAPEFGGAYWSGEKLAGVSSMFVWLTSNASTFGRYAISRGSLFCAARTCSRWPASL